MIQRFKISKQIELINDRVRQMLKEVSAKFARGNIQFATSDRFVNQVNSLMGQLNMLIYGSNSNLQSLDCFDHCKLLESQPGLDTDLSLQEVARTH